MKKLNRRTFLLIAGAGGAAAAAGVAVPAVTLLAKNNQTNILSFRAVGGMPDESTRLPAYCSYVLSGHVDLTAKSGTITRQMHAGFPDGTNVSPLVWPGFSQTIRVTNVTQSGNTITITGVVDDKSQLLSGESANVTIKIENASQLVDAPFSSGQAELKLV